MARPAFTPLTNTKPATKAHLAIIERTRYSQGNDWFIPYAIERPRFYRCGVLVLSNIERKARLASRSRLPRLLAVY